MITTAPQGILCDALVDFNPAYPNSVRIIPQDKPIIVSTKDKRERVFIYRANIQPEDRHGFLTSRVMRGNVIFHSLSRKARQKYRHVFLRSQKKISPKDFDKHIIAVKIVPGVV